MVQSSTSVLRNTPPGGLMEVKHSLRSRAETQKFNGSQNWHTDCPVKAAASARKVFQGRATSQEEDGDCAVQRVNSAWMEIAQFSV